MYVGAGHTIIGTEHRGMMNGGQTIVSNNPQRVNTDPSQVIIGSGLMGPPPPPGVPKKPQPEPAAAPSAKRRSRSGEPAPPRKIITATEVISSVDLARKVYIAKQLAAQQREIMGGREGFGSVAPRPRPGFAASRIPGSRPDFTASRTPGPSQSFTSTAQGPIHGYTSAAPGPSHGFNSTAPGPSHGYTSAAPGPSHRYTSTALEPSHGYTSTAPGPSHVYTSVAPGSSHGFNSTSPGPSHGYTSAAPGLSHGFNSTAPGPSHGYISAALGPSHTYTSAAPGPSHTYTSAAPGPSHGFNSTAPGPSHGYTSTAPGPSHGFNSTAPGPSHGFNSTATGPSLAYTSTAQGPSHGYTSTAPGPSRGYTSTAPGPSHGYTSSLTGPSHVYTSTSPGLSHVYTSTSTRPSHVYTSTAPGPTMGFGSVAPGLSAASGKYSAIHTDPFGPHQMTPKSKLLLVPVPVPPTRVEITNAMRRGLPIASGSVVRNAVESYLTPEETIDGLGDEKRASYKRFKQNEMLMKSIFTDDIVPANAKVVTTDYLTSLKQKVEKLEKYRQKELDETVAMMERHAAKLKKIKESRERDDAKFAITPPPITIPQIQRLSDRIYENYKQKLRERQIEDHRKHEASRRAAAAATLSTLASTTVPVVNPPPYNEATDPQLVLDYVNNDNEFVVYDAAGKLYGTANHIYDAEKGIYIPIENADAAAKTVVGTVSKVVTAAHTSSNVAAGENNDAAPNVAAGANGAAPNVAAEANGAAPNVAAGANGAAPNVAARANGAAFNVAGENGTGENGTGTNTATASSVTGVGGNDADTAAEVLEGKPVEDKK